MAKLCRLIRALHGAGSIDRHSATIPEVPYAIRARAQDDEPSPSEVSIVAPSSDPPPAVRGVLADRDAGRYAFVARRTRLVAS